VWPYLLIGLAGFAGSFHCLGMCSGFACALGRDRRGRAATLGRHLIYNAGRVCSYCFLGALAGSLGAALVLHAADNPVITAQRLLALISGALMIFIGLQHLGYLKREPAGLPGLGGQFFAQALREVLKAPGPAAPLAFGVFNGFLPCPLVYAFAAQAAASGGPLPGLLIMAAFGLGTFPAMLLAGGAGAARLGFNWRLRGIRVAGLFIVVFGLITLVRGAVPGGGHSHPVSVSDSSWHASPAAHGV